MLDPGAVLPVQGYAGHYCSLPKRKNPKIVGCSMILSGLRFFDIRNVRKPKEVAYFNEPTVPGANSLNPTALGGVRDVRPRVGPGPSHGLVHRRQQGLLRRRADQRRRPAAAQAEASARRPAQRRTQPLAMSVRICT